MPEEGVIFEKVCALCGVAIKRSEAQATISLRSKRARFITFTVHAACVRKHLEPSARARFDQDVDLDAPSVG